MKLEVVPGEPIRLRRVTIEVQGEAAGLAAFELPDESRPKKGDVLDHGRYERIKRFFRNQAQTHGFFDGAFVTRELRVDPEAGYADINLVYDSGERYTLGEVRFPDDNYFENALLERFVRFEPGEPYHSDRIIELNRELRGSGYFSNVRVEADAGNATKGRIPVQVALEERSRHSIGTGLGFSTDVGPRIRTTWDQHYVNPQGHRRGAELELSEPRQNAGLYYEVPLDPPMSDSLRFTGSYQKEDIEDTESERISTGAQWHTELDSGWQQVLSLRREDDRFKVGDERERTLLILPGASYSYLKRDSPVDPSRGYRLRVEAAGGQRDMLSDIDVLHATAEAKGLITLGTGGHRFLSRIKVGAVGTNNFDRVPPFLRFFAGGDQSVRGYGFRTLSPLDEDGDSIGGRFLIAGSAEYQYPLSQSWRLAAFVDEGNAFDDMGDPLKTGVGVGVRWISPVGPIRLDIARALDAPENFRLHFSMGPEL
jgi:Outer membrane protein